MIPRNPHLQPQYEIHSMKSPQPFSTRIGVLITGILLSVSLSVEARSYVGTQLAGFDLDAVTRRDAGAAVVAASAWIESLDATLRSEAMLPMNSGEWSAWSNLPATRDYAGVRLADMSEAQLKAAFTLFATSLSPAGFHKIKGILLGDDLLVPPGGNTGRMLFGSDNYWLILFGDPDPEKPWGWQLDGHHLGLNVTRVGDQITIAPSFIGTQPAEVQWSPDQKFNPMQSEVDRAFRLLHSLDVDQRARTVLGERRQGFVAGPGNDDAVPEKIGIRGSRLTPDQRQQLRDLIAEWVHLLPAQSAERRMTEIEASLPETHFAWFGETEDNSPVYFRIHGPTILIEFAHQNLGGNPLQHLHSVYRNPLNDYGKKFMPR